MPDLNALLDNVAGKAGSDLYLMFGAPPCAKVDGQLLPLSTSPLEAAELNDIANALMDDEQRRRFAADLEMNLAYTTPGGARFRVNLYRQRNEISIVARYIKDRLPDTEALGLPPILRDVVMLKHGLVLFVGATGSGKSTSLAALIDYRNTHAAGHIITIEDPLEFLHRHKKSLISQREVGTDTRSYHNALVNALRQAPDVILIGEIRNRETMEQALAYAETGHLCISTLHANNSNQALDRIVNFFPEDKRDQILLDLSLNLRAFVAMRLIPGIDGKRHAAVEVMLGSPTVRELIRRGEVHAIKEIMKRSEDAGMQTFDTALFRLHMDGKISLSEATRHADSANDLRLRVKLEKDRIAATSAGLKLAETGKFPGKFIRE